MITADKRYINYECKLVPTPEAYDEVLKNDVKKYLTYSCYLNWEALLKECNDIAMDYRAESLGNSYFGADKIADDIYIVFETINDRTYYIPYVAGISEPSSDNDCYLTRDEAILAALTTKYLKDKRDTHAIANAIARMIDMPKSEVEE